MRDSFGRRNEEALAKVREAREKRGVLEKELGRVREELGTRTAEMGGLEEARRAHERALGRREEVLKEVALRHGFKGLEVSMGDDQIEEIKSFLHQTLREETGKLDKLKVSIMPIPNSSPPEHPLCLSSPSVASVCIVSKLPGLERISNPRKQSNRPTPRHNTRTTDPNCHQTNLNPHPTPPRIQTSRSQCQPRHP